MCNEEHLYNQYLVTMHIGSLKKEAKVKAKTKIDAIVFAAYLTELITGNICTDIEAVEI